MCDQCSAIAVEVMAVRQALLTLVEELAANAEYGLVDLGRSVLNVLGRGASGGTAAARIVTIFGAPQAAPQAFLAGAAGFILPSSILEYQQAIARMESAEQIEAIGALLNDPIALQSWQMGYFANLMDLNQITPEQFMEAGHRGWTLFDQESLDNIYNTIFSETDPNMFGRLVAAGPGFVNLPPEVEQFLPSYIDMSDPVVAEQINQELQKIITSSDYITPQIVEDLVRRSGFEFNGETPTEEQVNALIDQGLRDHAFDVYLADWASQQEEDDEVDLQLVDAIAQAVLRQDYTGFYPDYANWVDDVAPDDLNDEGEIHDELYAMVLQAMVTTGTNAQDVEQAATEDNITQLQQQQSDIQSNISDLEQDFLNTQQALQASVATIGSQISNMNARLDRSDLLVRGLEVRLNTLQDVFNEPRRQAEPRPGYQPYP